MIIIIMVVVLLAAACKPRCRRKSRNIRFKNDNTQIESKTYYLRNKVRVVTREAQIKFPLLIVLTQLLMQESLL